MKFHKSIKFRMSLWYWMILVVIVLFFSLVTFFLLARQPNRTNYEVVNLSEFTVGSTPIGSTGNFPVNSQIGFSYKPLFAYSINESLLQKIKTQTPSLIELTISERLLSFDQKAFITPDMEGGQDVWLYYRPIENEPGYFEIMAVT